MPVYKKIVRDSILKNLVKDGKTSEKVMNLYLVSELSDRNIVFVCNVREIALIERMTQKICTYKLEGF